MTKRRIFFKEYSSEELCDLERDMSEAFDPRFNPKNITQLETDEHGFHKGTFRVSIVWRSEDDCDCTGFQHQSSCQHHWSNDPNGEVPF
jgi:hypothetical protein